MTMRIAIDLTPLLPVSTGIDTYLIELVRHLAQVDQENDYKIFVNFEDRGVFDGCLPRRFRIVPFSFRPRSVRLAFQQMLFPLAAAGWHTDVVHSPSFIMPLVRGYQRHVLTVHDMTSFTLPHCHIALRRSALYRRLVLWSIRRAHLILVPSRATREEILRVVPELPAERVEITALGIGAEFRPCPPEQVRAVAARLKLPRAYILFVGTIEPRKNLERLVESYALLADGGGVEEHLVIAGRLGWGYESLFARIRASPLRERIHIMGYVDASDLPGLYSGARLFVYPSLQEGFGFPPLEAMACGTPVVSSLTSSLAENLEGAAELVTPDDANALTGAMRLLLKDEALHIKRRDQGIERAAKFRWRETAHRTLAGYRAVAAKKST